MSNQNDGEQTKTPYSVELKNTSHDFGTILASEQWLLSNGLIAETSADTLLGYAYMIPGVEKADLVIDMDYKNDGRNPSVTYKVTLEKKLSKKYKALTEAIKEGSLKSKVVALGYLLLETPSPGYFENQIKELAHRYLPSNFKVIVNVG